MGAPKVRPSQRPKVIDYHDYRAFLKDWFAYLESGPEGFSLRQLARAAGVGVSLLSMCLNGKRGLSAAVFAKLRAHLGLGERDLQYLDLLREMAEAPTQEDRVRVMAHLQKRQEYKNRHPQEFETFHYLSAWYFVAIREMAALPDFKPEAQWVQSRLREHVPLENVTKALAFLKEHGFIGDTPGPQKNLECAGGVYRVALRNFHKEMLNQVHTAIENVPADHRQILGHTLAIPAEHLDQVSTILQEALTKIENLGEQSTPPDTVYHITLAAVPLTRKADRPDE